MPVIDTMPTILVVDDDPGVRRLLVDLLDENGYRVLEAGGASEALAVLFGHHGDVDLLLTDVVMPGLSGFALAREIRSLRPDIRVLYCSGYIAPHEWNEPLYGPMICKPFRTDEVLALVRKTLGTP